MSLRIEVSSKSTTISVQSRSRKPFVWECALEDRTDKPYYVNSLVGLEILQ